LTKPRGFTLIELVIAMTLLTVINCAVIHLLFQGWKIWQKYNLQAQRIQVINYLGEVIARDIRAARQRSVEPQSGELILSTEGETIAYLLVDGKVRRKKSGTNNYLTSSEQEINKMEFKIIDSGNVETILNENKFTIVSRNINE